MTFKNILKTFVFASMYSVLNNLQNIYTFFTYKKKLLHTLLLLVFKIIVSLQCILKAFYLTKMEKYFYLIKI